MANPFSIKAAGTMHKIDVHFIKGVAAPSEKIDTPLSRGAAGPRNKRRKSLSHRGGHTWEAADQRREVNERI